MTKIEQIFNCWLRNVLLVLGKVSKKKKYKKVDRRFTLGGGGFAKQVGGPLFCITFFSCLLVLTFNCNPMIVGAKTLYLKEISDFSDYLDLSQPLKK